MATWKKVIVSGSNASLLDVSASGTFIGDGSGLTGIINAGMAANSIDSDQYVNASIDPEHLADNAVTLAKMAGLARGKIISGDSSGDPVALAAGGANTVLQSDGTDITYNTVATAMIADNAVSLAKMAGLARGKIISGDSSGDPVALAAGGANTVLQSDGTDITYGTVATAMIANDAVDADKLASNAVVNASIAANAAIAHSKLAALASTKVLVGNGSNVAAEVPLSGDVTMANTGAVTIAANAVDGGKLADSFTVAAELTVAGHGLTVKQISASSHISASGNVIAAEFIGGGENITGVTVADNAITLAKMAGLARGKIISGDSSGDPVALSPGGANTVLQSDGTDITYGTVATAMIANDAVDADKLASNAVVNASIAANAAIAHSKLAALAATKVLVGNGSNVAVEVPLSGDVTMNNAGAVTIGANKVTLAKMAGLARGKIISGDSSGDPVALAAGGANTVLQSDGTDITYNTVATAMIADNAVSLAKMAGLARGKIIAGDSSGDPAALAVGSANTVLQSDGTDVSYGTVATAMIANDAVDADKLASNAVVNASIAANAAIAHSKLAALASTKVLVGNGSNVAAEVPLSGDVTMANTGAVTIAANAVDGDKLADSIVIAADLTVTGDLLVSGDSVTVNTANLNVEDPFILLKSGSSNTSDSGIIFGGSTGTANTGKAIVWDASYNSNDGRLAVSTAAVAGDATANFGAGTTGYYVAGAFLGSAANAATALADHAGNIRIESSEIYIYV